MMQNIFLLAVGIIIYLAIGLALFGWATSEEKNHARYAWSALLLWPVIVLAAAILALFGVEPND